MTLIDRADFFLRCGAPEQAMPLLFGPAQQAAIRIQTVTELLRWAACEPDRQRADCLRQIAYSRKEIF